VIVLASLGACTAGGSGDDTSSSQTSVTGQGVYRDATTTDQGAPQAAASPSPQTADMDIVVDGQGTLPTLDPQCAPDPTGAFQALFTGTATFDASGAYVAALGQGAGTITTPDGCAIPSLTVGAITDVKVRVLLDANTENCQSYCSASARADAESQCSASADEATCRANAESSLEASCETQCTTQSTKIAAEVTLDASAVGQLTADQLQGAALGDLNADLTFDTLQP